jgi:hypothetical protein
MANGMTKPIEKIRVGDVVQTFDEVTGEMTTSPVSEIFHHDEKTALLYDIEMSNGDHVTSNDVHLFYLSDYKKYLSAKELFELWKNKSDISLSSVDGSPVKIVRFTERVSVTKLFNIHVVGPYDHDTRYGNAGHNYFAGGVLVHNEKSEQQLNSVLQTRRGTCCHDLEVDDSYPRHADCSGTQADKDAYNVCLGGGG